MNQLELLMNYTKFHIGVYLTLGAIGVGLLRAGEADLAEVGPSLLFLVLAGACGGVIGSTIPEYETFDRFRAEKLGFWRLPMMRYASWALLEHLFFWIAILRAAQELVLS